MDATELRRQKIVAKAHLDSLTQLYEHGSATMEEVNAQRKIWEDLKGFGPAPLATCIGALQRTTNLKGMNPDAVIYDSSFEEAAELEAIRAELHEIDMRKNAKINELAKLDRTTKQKAMVDEIKALREEFVNKSDEKYYFQRHGERFSTTLDMTGKKLDMTVEGESSELVNFDDSEYVKSLPRDKMELYRLKKNQETYLSKYQGRLEKAKTEVKKASQRRNISIANIKINTLDQLIATL